MDGRQADTYPHDTPSEQGDENARGHIGTELNNKAETVLLVEKDKSNGDISKVSAMHIRAMDFEPFAFRINERALPELMEDYQTEAKTPGRPQAGSLMPTRTFPSSSTG